MTKEQIYELIKLLLKEQVFFSFNPYILEFFLYDYFFDIKVYNNNLSDAIKKFVIETDGKYSNNFVKKLFKIAGMKEKYYEN